MERQELDRRVEVGDIEFISRFFSTDISIEELLESYNAERRDFSDIGLCNLDLSGIYLIGANLTVVANKKTFKLIRSNFIYK